MNKKNRKDNGKLKIAMIGHKRIPSREGGVEIVVEELAVRMAAKGHTVEAYNRYGHHVSDKKYDEDYGRKGREYYKGVRVRIIPTFENSKLNAIVYSFFATLRALPGDYDVLHYHAEGPCAMLWIAKLFGKRVVVTVHGLDWQRAKWGNFASKVLKTGEKVAAKYADEIIVLSQNVQEYFKTTYGRNTHYIPNGIENPVLREAKQIKDKWGLEKDSYILFLARIVPEKGLHYLIDAYEQLHTDKKLVIAGGSSNAMEYMEKIRRKASENENILMTDFVQGEILAELLSNAYLFVLPSDIEGMSISLLEAMSYGNCCLVSDINENIEVVEDMALSFRKGDVQDLKEKLSGLLEDKAKVEAFKQNASGFITNKYNWDNVIDETLKLYKKPANMK